MWRRIITSSRPICDQIEQGCSIDLRSWRIKWTKEEGGHYCRGSWQEKWRRRRPLDPATTSNPNPNRPFRDANFTPRDQPEPRQISWTAADIPRAPDGTGCRRPNVPPTGHWVTDKAQLPGAVDRRRDWSVSFAPDPAGAIKKSSETDPRRSSPAGILRLLPGNRPPGEGNSKNGRRQRSKTPPSFRPSPAPRPPPPVAANTAAAPSASAAFCSPLRRGDDGEWQGRRPPERRLLCRLLTKYISVVKRNI